MNKKWIIPIGIVLCLLFILIVAFSGDNSGGIDNSGEVKYFNVSSGPSELSAVVDSIKTLPYYEGYDAETVKWMESLGNRKVFIGDDCIVIMSSLDAEKIPQDPGITDVYVYNHFTAKIVENYELGNEFPTVYNVENVKFINQEIVGNGLA